jgi:hypothetical protein
MTMRGRAGVGETPVVNAPSPRKPYAFIPSAQMPQIVFLRAGNASTPSTHLPRSVNAT